LHKSREEHAGQWGGDFDAGAVSQFRGGTGALATNVEEGLYARILFIFEGMGFDGVCAWIAVSGLDDENDGARPLGCHH